MIEYEVVDNNKEYEKETETDDCDEDK